MKRSIRIIFIMTCLGLLILTSSACSLFYEADEGEMLHLEQTRTVLSITQTAIDQSDEADTIPLPTEPKSTDIPTAEVITDPSPTIEPTTSVVPDVDFEGISFSYDDSIADSVTMAIVPQHVDEYGFPGNTYPNHFKFDFNGYCLEDTFHQPVIRVYPIAEFTSIDSYSGDVIDQLQTLLQTKPAIPLNQLMPLLPRWNAGQMFSAKAHYLDFQNGSGLRYMTMHGQSFYPIDNYHMFYTYQGITNDGKYVVSAILPITNPALPLRGEDGIEDWNAFFEFFETYIFQAATQVDEFTPDSFVPSMTLLDEMMASFLIRPAE